MNGSDPGVTVVDRVTLPRVDADAWLARLHRDYRPAAERRGYRLAGVRRTRAAYAHSVEIVVEWQLDDVRAFWRARAGGQDEAVAGWWKMTDTIALARTRAVLAPA